MISVCCPWRGMQDILKRCMVDFSKIKFNSSGFWIHQAFIEVLSEYICDVFENIGVNTFSGGL
jgi:hypothetical protein